MFERNQIQGIVESSSSEASQTNLTLGRILMAIDNLYERSRGDKKTKRQEYLDYIQNNENEKKKGDQKKKNKDNKKQQEEQEEKEQDDYNQKTKQAVAKLKFVSEQIKYFKKVLDNVKAENKIQKQNAKYNY